MRGLSVTETALLLLAAAATPEGEGTNEGTNGRQQAQQQTLASLTFFFLFRHGQCSFMEWLYYLGKVRGSIAEAPEAVNISGG